VARNDRKPFTSVDKLPDDPLAMPPPYWRGSGAVFHVLDSLSALSELLRELVPINERTASDLGGYYEKYPEGGHGNAEIQEFADICGELWELEHRIKLRCETAVLMSAIEAEDEVNMFCVFNLPRDVAEPIEKLSLPEKLLIASTLVGKKNAKSDAAFESISKLTAWRNAFAHGHCVDRPVKSLRHNHLISPPEYPGVPDTLATTIRLVSHYVRVSEYLRSISINPYTGGTSTDVAEIRKFLRDIGRYHFKGHNHAYTIAEKDRVS
jgi:hypothetical protein